MVSESRKLHLKAIAENQANTLDLFLSERLVNLANVIDDPKFMIPPSSEALQASLGKLQKDSPAFVDIGYFDPSGVQAAYAGPFPSLEQRNYSLEDWYIALKPSEDNFIITDIYLGFRQKPHFTIAVSRTFGDQFVVLRATLGPEQIYEYIRSLEGSSEVYTSIVNREGYYQLVTSHIGTPLETSSFVPPKSPRLGAEEVRIEGASVEYGYSWLRNAEWGLIVQWSAPQGHPLLTGFGLRLLIVSAVFILVILLVIIRRAGKVAEFHVQSDETKAQLEHAAKLASVGELAAGIAHEVNNPLAAISEEAGLMKDLLDPEYEESASTEELMSHLDSISDSVFRCRDITRKLLGFVRSDTVILKPHDIHRLIDDVVDGFLIRELAASNITIAREYGDGVPRLQTDANQLQQVILNMLNNSVDAIGNRPGRITIGTSIADGEVSIRISDTGSGMTREQLNKIFLPFYTTKEVGKGTGLGLSVSYGIIKDLGGRIEVESSRGQGSTFTIVLPLR
jgi:two-component system NtrC family sensor kinase